MQLYRFDARYIWSIDVYLRQELASFAEKNGCVAGRLAFAATGGFSDKDGKRGKTRGPLKPFFEHSKFSKSNRTAFVNLIGNTDQSFRYMGTHDKYEEKRD
ncbi:hypothetical protein SAMN06295970_118106 [Noviherbaspirillum suwonense]|uniref:Uncharacterized protein n=1 Tax=Noviherbaspirillum suwonense TaxID=1224511 RepID=A0ABY1QM29_9BURK|nr:hypothetical protein SAMN06295970_118106 [Noviherbaspirillum suwonense]